MSLWLPERPAFAGRTPPALRWAPAAASTQATLKAMWGAARTFERLQTDAPPPRGYYRSREAPALFIKVVPHTQLATQLTADRCAAFLARAGLPTQPLIEGGHHRWGANAVLAHPLIDGRHATPTVEELSALGATIGQMHQALLHWPKADAVRAAGEARIDALAAIAASPPPLPPEAGRAAELLDPRGLAPLRGPAQCVHGDLNRGNVLFDRTTGAPWLLDFENAGSAWLPPASDLAFAIERFAEGNVALTRALLDGWCTRTGRAAFDSPEALPATLEALAVRALAVLTAQVSRGARPLASEWAKFIESHAAASTRAEALIELARGYC